MQFKLEALVKEMMSYLVYASLCKCHILFQWPLKSMFQNIIQLVQLKLEITDSNLTTKNAT